MPVAINPAKEALRRGEVAIGTWILHAGAPAIASLLARAGFHFLYIDSSHSTFTTEQISALCSAARSAGAAPIIRPWLTDEMTLNRALELGAMGLLVPDVATPDDVRRVVLASKFHPEGTRGMATIGPATDWYRLKRNDFAEVNRQNLVAIQLESEEAFSNLDEIMAVPGLDVVVVGRFDLSQNLGLRGQVDHPMVLERVERMIDAARRHGVTPGMLMPNAKVAREWIAKGMRWIPCATEVQMLTEAGQRIVQEIEGENVTEVPRNQPS